MEPRGERYKDRCEDCAFRARALQYGITVEEYRQRIVEPCAVCGSTEKLNLDHDHATGRVRGTLCGKCNRALGLLQESLANVRALVAYLEKVS
jgi:hypothetical protein